eukprot:4260884-Prymnesium_polylepis.1
MGSGGGVCVPPTATVRVAAAYGAVEHDHMGRGDQSARELHDRAITGRHLAKHVDHARLRARRCGA